MSEHPIELPEHEPEPEEREKELEKVTELTHEVIEPERTEVLERESTAYAQESAVLDHRVEAQERIQNLESSSSTSNTPPARRALRRAANFRVSALQRKQTPPTPNEAARTAAKATADKLSALDTTLNRDESVAAYDRSLDTFGTSLDQAFVQRWATAEQLTRASEVSRIRDALGAGWTAQPLIDALVALSASAQPGHPVDLAAAVKAAESALRELTTLSAAVGGGLDAPHCSAAVHTIARGVERTLSSLLDGKALPPSTTAQRFADLGTRLSSLEAEPLDGQRAEVARLRSTRDEAANTVALQRAEAAQKQRDLADLAHQNSLLQEEYDGASADRKKQINAELTANAKKEAFWKEKLADANNEIRSKQDAVKRARVDLAAAEAVMQEMADTIAAGGLAFGKVTKSNNWRNAVSQARKALADPSLAIPDQARQRLDAGLATLGANLDAQFDTARTAAQSLSDDASSVLTSGWAFSQLVNGVGTTLAGLDAPAAAAPIANQLYVVLAQMSGYVGMLMNARSALPSQT